MEKKDFKGLFSLVLAIYDEIPESLNFKSRPDAELFSLVFANKISALEADAAVDLVAEDDGLIAGNCEIVRIGDDSGVLGIVVGKRHRRTGIGSAMLKKACADAASIGMRRIIAEISPGNKTAVKFLEANGWKIDMPGQKGVSSDSHERVRMFAYSAAV